MRAEHTPICTPDACDPTCPVALAAWRASLDAKPWRPMHEWLTELLNTNPLEGAPPVTVIPYASAEEADAAERERRGR